MRTKDLQHLFWRAGFGVLPNSIKQNEYNNRENVVDSLFADAKAFRPLKIDTTDIDKYWSMELLKDKKKRATFINNSTNKIKEYNAIWFDRLINSEQALRERMTLFWANHFVCRDINIYHVQQYNNTLREHALGNFGDFVKAISKEPVMLKYLNNKQNKKQKPNENFARELMELFMLGEGHFTEEDVKESARAFTGYNHNFEGDFILRRFHHDYGFKSFFGHTGRYDGDDIIDIILEQKQCARFICSKLYKYFVNDQVNSQHVEELTSVFYEDYEIEKVMRYLFMADWFYEEKNIGTKIKSPIDLVVGMCKTVPVTFNKFIDIIKIQKLLGQVLLNPPNVAGWPGGKNWIDSNTMMLRLKLPSIILADAKIPIKEKGDFEDSFKRFNSKRRTNRFADVDVNWDDFDKAFNLTSFKEMKEQLVVSNLSSGVEDYLNSLSKNSKRDYCIQLMSLPEYQMC